MKYAGRKVLDLTPNGQFHRFSEGAFIACPDGRLLFGFTRFFGGSADDSTAEIAAAFSVDDGRSFGPPFQLVENHGARNIMSLTLGRGPQGSIVMFYLVKNSWADCRLYSRSSLDGGKSWSRPRPVIRSPGYFVVNNDRLLITHDHQWWIPAAFHRTRKTKGGATAIDLQGLTLFFHSPDGGRQWRESESFVPPPFPSRMGLQEPVLIEPRPGHLRCYARSGEGYHFQFDSRDGGRTFGKPRPSPFLSPCSPLSIKEIPNMAGNFIAVYNDATIDQPRRPASWGRTPLVLRWSPDRAKSWSQPLIIENHPGRGYCYCALHFTAQGSLLLAYCAGGKRDGGVLNRLLVRRFRLRDILIRVADLSGWSFK